MKLRFLPSACARRCRIPEGRLSNTCCSTFLYAATCSCAASGLAFRLMRADSALRNSGLYRGQRRGCNGEHVQSTFEQRAYMTLFARQVPAQADLAPVLCAVRDDRAHHAQEGGSRLRQGGKFGRIATRRGQILDEVVAADR